MLFKTWHLAKTRESLPNGRLMIERFQLLNALRQITVNQLLRGYARLR